MPSNLFFRWTGIIMILLISYFSLSPSIKYYTNRNVEVINYFEELKKDKGSEFSLNNFNNVDYSLIEHTLKHLDNQQVYNKITSIISKQPIDQPIDKRIYNKEILNSIKALSLSDTVINKYFERFGYNRGRSIDINDFNFPYMNSNTRSIITSAKNSSVKGDIIDYFSMVPSEMIKELSLIENQVRTQEKSAINLGLDLKGGTYLEYSIDMSDIVEKHIDRYIDLDKKQKIYEIVSIASDNKSGSFLDSFIAETENLELKLYFDIQSLDDSSNQAIIDYFIRKREAAINTAIKVINRRVNKSGMAEPSIRKKGSDRIVVELAGIKDTKRAKGMIETRANLKFLRVISSYPMIHPSEMNDDSFLDQLVKIDNTISNNKDLNNKVKLILNDKSNEDEYNRTFISLFSSPISFSLQDKVGFVGVYEKDVKKIDMILNLPAVKVLINTNKAIMWSSDIETDNGGNQYREIFYLEHKTKPLGQGDIEEASAQKNTFSDPGMRDPYYVSLTINSNKKDFWKHITKQQAGRRLAIVLENEVYIAPTVADDPETKKRGMGRRVTVTGGFNTWKEANDLATVIVAGQLDAPLQELASIDIEASLGKDSINNGLRSIIIGMILVLFFMTFYYRWSGTIASIALVLNLFFILGFFGLMAISDITATLTLPGIAGIILTIGMSVDANVIIFERIREELESGKRAPLAIRHGYEKAFITIIDANLTTFIAALVLGAVASGPIQGFALTLIIGIISSIFTAVFLTKTIFLTIIHYKQISRLSI